MPRLVIKAIIVTDIRTDGHPRCKKTNNNNSCIKQPHHIKHISYNNYYPNVIECHQTHQRFLIARLLSGLIILSINQSLTPTLVTTIGGLSFVKERAT